MKVLETHTEINLNHALIKLIEERSLPTLHIWPVLLEDEFHLIDIHIILTDFSFLKRFKLKKLFSNYKTVDDIIYLKSINHLDSQQSTSLQELSSYSGHINVLYKTNNYNFVNSLIKHWANSPCLTDMNELCINDKWLSSFNQIYSNRKKNELIFGFGHDGSPMFIFAEVENLKKFCNKI
jgi:hypothetical protein